MKRVLALLLVAFLMGGCGDADFEEFFTGPGGPGVVAPQAADDAYDGLGNAPIMVAAAEGVLVNDPVPAPVTAFTSPTAQGGTVNVTADGSFVYTPAAGFNGQDSFTYTTTNAAGQAVATVRVQVAGNAVFVDNTNVPPATLPNGDGSLADPFNTLAAATAGSGPGDTIFVFRGDGTNTGYAGPVDLQDGQRLIGEGSGLVARGEVRAQTVVPPGLFPLLTGPVNMADGCTVQGLRIEGSPGDAIDGQFRTDGAITDCEIVDSGNDGIDLSPHGGDWLIARNTITRTGPTGAGVFADIGANQGPAASSRLVIAENVITDCTLNAVLLGAADDATFTVQARDNVMIDNQVGVTFEVIIGGEPLFCLDLFGNTNDDVYRFVRLHETATFDVEDLSRLEEINTGTVVVPAEFLPVTEVPDGFCGF